MSTQRWIKEGETLTDGSASDQGDGKNVLIRSASGTSDQTRALQTLNTKTILGTDDGGDLVSSLTLVLDLFGDDSLYLAILKSLLGLRKQVKVFETRLLPLTVVPGDVEVWYKLFGHTDASTGVSRKIDAGDAKLAGKLRALVEELIFLGAERTNPECDVVGNDDEFTAAWVLGSAGQ